ncbi:MAG: serine/threonine-protein kinase [Candidatus Eisenbacteria bacterium]|nr:serine/threonine-protein kinase [Candidatus Eisenbacteria bacterium]
MIGKTISHFRVLSKLGEGGMGVVYKALDTRLGRFVALKFLTPDVSIGADDRARFLREARAASAVSHPNVCVIYEIAEDEGRQFIVMEYVDGKTLKQMLPIQELEEALGYAIQVCEALQEAHDKGVVHRDIKTDNVMVNEKNQVKVMDFGLAKLRGSLMLTKTSTTVGTLAYMAPEQIQGGEVDARSDIFSFGVVLYESLTGHLPFVGEHEAAVMYSIVNANPQPIRKFRPELPSELIHILDRALEKDPKERYQTAGDLLIDLRRAKIGSTKSATGSLARRPGLPAYMNAPRMVLNRLSAGTRKISNRNLVLIAFGILMVAAVLVSSLVGRKQPVKPAVALHKQITFSGTVGLTALSPDGNFVAYVSQVSPTEAKMYVQDIAGGQPIEVFSEKSFCAVRWSPDGSEILISAGNDSAWGGYILPRLGGTPQRVLDFNYASWSPDGSQLALSRFLSQKRIWLANKVSGDTVSIPLKGNFTWLHDVDWSPAGGLLLFNAVGEKRCTIWTVTTDGSRQSKVLEDSVVVSSPRFSSRGDAIYYLRPQGQTDDLMKIKVDPTNGRPRDTPVTIQTGLQAGAFFSMSKDEEHLLYTREQVYSNLWQADYQAGRTKTKQLAKGSPLIFSPRISPDGKSIAFSMGNLLQANIFVMPMEGGKAEQLTFLDSYNDAPVWSPDGKEIAFGSVQGGGCHVWTVSSNGGSPRQFKKTELSRDVPFVLAWAPCPDILYLRPGNRNLHFLDPITEEERPLVQDNSSGWMFSPRYSPDCEKVVIFWNRATPPLPGAWLISLADSSQTLLASGGICPIDWSTDGDWIYASKTLDNATEVLMLSPGGRDSRELLTFPFVFEDFGDLSVLPSGRKFVYVLSETRSDAWLMGNFDPAVRSSAVHSR